MTVGSPTAAAAQRQAYMALGLIAVLFAWFWTVAAHRIGDAPTAGFAGVFVTGCGDFEHFYQAALALREGRDLYAAGVHGYIYPPLLAFLFVPLTLLPVQQAALVMLAVNLGLGLFAAWLASTEVLRRLGADDAPGALLPVLALTLLLAALRLRSEFQMWQTNVPMMVLLLLALRHLDTRPGLAGALLGAAINIKYLPLAYLPYLIARRRFVAAAATLAGLLAFAALPALATGWDANLRHWSTALAGLAPLFGLAASGHAAANVDPLAVGHSISITSGIARLLGPAQAGRPALAAAAAVAAVGAVTLLVLVWVYRRHDVPLLRWPDAVGQRALPWRGLVALEWMALITLALAFGPQTNPRHTSLLLMAFAPLAAMLCLPRGSRREAFAAAAILFCGFALPPNTVSFAPALAWWREVGGAGWSMAVAMPLLLAAGFRYLAATPRSAGLSSPASAWPPRGPATSYRGGRS